MKTIHKYPLTLLKTQTITMPDEAKVMCVQTQGGIPCIWAAVDTDMPLVNRSFLTVGTGHEITVDTLWYVGTYQQENGEFIWHVYEISPISETSQH